MSLPLPENRDLLTPVLVNGLMPCPIDSCLLKVDEGPDAHLVASPFRLHGRRAIEFLACHFPHFESKHLYDVKSWWCV
jgi:hypothetical protein